MNESADFVMYWWDHAAEILGRKGTALRRFGLVTTNSISQVFQRRIMEQHLNRKNPISLVFAIPDHPWTKATKDAAAVRIAMTVCEAGKREGVLWKTVSEMELDTDEPQIGFSKRRGMLNSDLSAGLNLTRAVPLQANHGLCSRGVQLMGSGFIVTRVEAEHLGLGDRPGLERHIRPYRNGRDLTAYSRNVMAIDLLGLSAGQVRRDFPEVYQHLLERVKPHRDSNNRASYRDNWWVFGEPRRELRPALEGLPRYIATVETAKHRIFQFLDTTILPDNKVICFALSNAEQLSVLQSRIHRHWYLANSAMLGVYDRDAVYVKSRCFDPFPFPELTDALREKLRSAGEELDATRKRVLEGHPDLTLTGLYNVLEKVNAGTEMTEKDEDVKERGLILILKELHEAIDRLAAEAYGWPADLAEEEILTRLVALNAERAREEATGFVRWLRPDYQLPRFAKDAKVKSGELALEAKVVAIDKGLPVFPADRDEQVLAVEAMLVRGGRAMDAAELARGFRRGGKRIEKRVGQLLVSLARYGHITALPDGRFAAREGGRLAA